MEVVLQAPTMMYICNRHRFTKNALYKKSIGQILGMMNSKISQEIEGNERITGRTVTDFIHMETMYQNLGHTWYVRRRPLQH